MDFNMYEIMEQVAIWGLPVLMAITFHEAAHGYVAKKYGDNTAYMLGRVTLNPFSHIDLFGTIVMPIALLVMGLPMLGYAKPVPVNFRNLKPYKKAVVAVAGAGPLMNLVLALISTIIVVVISNLKLPVEQAKFLAQVAWASVQINVLLFVFNLLPIPPLDGSRILSVILPPRLNFWYSKIEPYGMWIVLALAVSGGLFYILKPAISFTLELMWNVIRVYA